jgi:TrmH family RNA methyltransferase
VITSAQNPRIQRVRALIARRQERDSSGEAVLEGVRLVEEALDSAWQPKLLLYTAELSPRGLELVHACRVKGLEVEEVTPALLKSTADTENPQGVLGVFARRELPLPAQLDFVVVADALRDPGNLGTLLRTCQAAGAQALFLAPGSADPYSPKVLRSAMGAHFHLPIQALDWPGIAKRVKPGCRLLLADSATGEPCWQADLAAPLALVVGSEAEGPGPEARALADGSVTIPMPGHSESLNAAVAAGILLFEVVRQRRKN